MTSPDPKPLIIHVVRQFLPNRGGLEDVVANLCQKLLTRGFRVRVVTLDRLFTDRDTVLPAKETINGIEIVRIPWSGSSRYPLAPSVFKHLADADLVHVHAIDFFYDALAFGWLLHRKTMIATTHGGFFHTKAHGRLKTIWFNVTTRLSSLAYRTIVCCSPADKRQFDQIAASRTLLIENGVDTGKFADAASTSPLRRMITIGRFSSNKRIDNLLDTMAELVKIHPDWHLDIAGVPSDWSEADIRAAIAARRLDTAVSLHIGIPNEAIRGLMGQCSFFASASDYEGFGLVAIEAMSAGLIPLLQPNDAYRDLAARHGEIALVDFAAAATAAADIKSRFSALATTGTDLRTKARQAADLYSWDTVVNHYIAAYRPLLGH